MNVVQYSSIFYIFSQVGVEGLVPLTYVYVDSALLAGTQLTHRFRSTFIALHQHLDTYLDKRESAIVVSLIVRTVVHKYMYVK